MPLGGTWSSGGDLLARREYLSAAGYGQAGLAMGSYNLNPQRQTAEEYNGVAWSSIGTMGARHEMTSGCGSSTAAIVSSGLGVQTTEHWNGVAWSYGGDLGSAAQYGHGVGGSETAAIATGGYYGGQVKNWYWKYDGSTWTYGGTMPGGTRYVHAATGGMDDQIVCNGAGTCGANDTEVYDGVSFAAGVDTTVGGNYTQMSGDPVLALLVYSNYVNSFDGVTWVAENGLSVIRTKQPGITDTAAGLDYMQDMMVYGGTTVTTNEIWDNAPPTPVPYYGELITHVWSAMPNTVNYKREAGGCGTTAAALVFGGYSGNYNYKTDEYNGTAWENGGTMLDGRTNPRGFGTQTAGFVCGGKFGNSTTNVTYEVDEYDGTSWAAVDALTQRTYNGAASGTPMAGFVCGGMKTGSAPYLDTVESYDGTSWSTEAVLPGDTNHAHSCHGNATAALVVGGQPGAGGYTDATFTYNGTAWAASDDLVTGIAGHGATAGSLDDIRIFGGYNYDLDGITDSGQQYDGVAWATDIDSLDIRTSMASGGSGDSAWKATGWLNSSYSTLAQEYSFVSSFPVIAGAAIGSTALSKLYLGDTVVYDIT